MLDIIKKILTVLISVYITIFIANLFWERYETNKINNIIKKNYQKALDKLEEVKKISNLLTYVALDHNDYKNHKEKFIL